MNKKWLSAQDERTRETHQAVNGDTIGLKTKFTVGGSKLRFPGDPNGAASEVINCRCAMRHIPVGV